MLQLQQQMVAKVSGSRLVFELPAADLTSCEKSQPGLQTHVYKTYTVRLYAEINCTGTDLTKYNGQTFASLAAVQQSLCASAGTSIFNESADLTYTLSADNGAGPVYTMTMKFATMAGDSGPCQTTLQGTALVSDGCQHLELDTLNHGGTTSYRYSKKTTNHLSGPVGQPYFTSGTIDFIFDKWSGAMTYAGATVAPTWKAQAPGVAPTGATFAYLPGGQRPPTPASPSPIASTPDSSSLIYDGEDTSDQDAPLGRCRSHFKDLAPTFP